MGEKFSLSGQKENFKTYAEAKTKDYTGRAWYSFSVASLVLASVVSPSRSFYNREWANDLLRYAIKVSKGGGFSSPAGVRLSCLIRLRESLAEHRYAWHSRILNYHIHLFQKRNKSELQTLQGLTTKVKNEKRVSKSSVLEWYKHIPDGSESGGEL